MTKILVVCLTLVVVCVCESDEDYIDSVINMLLNGVGENASENTNEEPAVDGGIWKCGNCTDLGEAELVHSETNLGDDDMDNQTDSQITLMLPNLRCVTVSSDRPGAVQKVVGTCEGPSVTLEVSSSHNFTVFGYT